MSIKFVQPSKTSSPMKVTELGIVIDVKLAQLTKAEFPIFDSFA